TRVGNRFIQSFLNVLSRLAAGRLTLIMPDRSVYSLDSKTGTGPHAVIKINRWRALRRFMTEGEIGFVEAYVDGDWESPELADVVELAALNTKSLNTRNLQGLFPRLRNRIVHLLNANTRRGSRRNIAAHYDLGNEF